MHLRDKNPIVREIIERVEKRDAERESARLSPQEMIELSDQITASLQAQILREEVVPRERGMLVSAKDFDERKKAAGGVEAIVSELPKSEGSGFELNVISPMQTIQVINMMDKKDPSSTFRKVSHVGPPPLEYEQISGTAESKVKHQHGSPIMVKFRADTMADLLKGVNYVLSDELKLAGNLGNQRCLSF